MFEVIPEPEFEAWYESLPEPLAEEVATAIDLAASESGVIAPERLSRLLLWFDSTGSGCGPELGVPGLVTLPGWPALPTARAHGYLIWHQEVLLCLESAPFEDRLARLDPVLAARALTHVERLKRKLHAARFAGTWSPWSHSGQQATIPKTEADASGLRGAFLDLLSLMGLEPEAVLGSGSGLRELCIDNVRPQLRVLFGLDFPARRLIAILGESLDRRYYGASVDRAEQRWREYCRNLADQGRSATP
jgi:hypothetical protein